MNRFLSILIGFLLFSPFLNSLSAESRPEEVRPFRVGVIQSQTGIAAEDGKTVIQALRLAADHINQEDSTKVVLVIEDDQTTSKNSVSAWEKLKTSGVDAVIAATWDFTTNPLLPLAARDKVVLFNTSTLPESLNLAQTSGMGFINAVSVETEARPFDRFLLDHAPKNVTIVYANNSWGETQLSAYRKIAEHRGVTVLDEVKPATYDANEWQQIVPRIKSRSPELVLLLLNKNDIQIFLRKAHELKLSSAMFGSKNTFDAFQIEASKTLFENVCFTYPYEQVLKQPKFVVDYKARFSEEPRIYADNTYDALFILHKAYKESLKSHVILRDALRKVAFDGLVGSYRYDEKRSLSIGSSSLLCVKDGNLVVTHGVRETP